jgi:hypothetical protein
MTTHDLSTHNSLQKCAFERNQLCSYWDAKTHRIVGIYKVHLWHKNVHTEGSEIMKPYIFCKERVVIMIKNYTARTASCARGRFTCCWRSARKAPTRNMPSRKYQKDRRGFRAENYDPRSHSRAVTIKKHAASPCTAVWVAHQRAFFIVPNQRRTDTKSSYTLLVHLEGSELKVGFASLWEWSPNYTYSHLAIDLGFEVKH